MSTDPYDSRYRTGFDSYPEDHEKGFLTLKGREARRYMDLNDAARVTSTPPTNHTSMPDYCPGGDPAYYHPSGWKRSGLD